MAALASTVCSTSHPRGLSPGMAVTGLIVTAVAAVAGFGDHRATEGLPPPVESEKIATIQPEAA